MVTEVMPDESALESASVSATADHRNACGGPQRLNASFAKPTVTFLATDQILRHLLRRFPSRDLNSVPVANLVVDEHMRTETLKSCLSLESHPVAVGRVADLIDILPACRSHSLVPLRSLKETWFVR